MKHLLVGKLLGKPPLSQISLVSDFTDSFVSGSNTKQIFDGNTVCLAIMCHTDLSFPKSHIPGVVGIIVTVAGITLAVLDGFR